MMQAAIEKALSLVGQGYIYGAKGQTCSPGFRQQQAEQYPDQADNILGTGAKWDGVPVWDCAQLTRAVAKAAGVTLVSGATSQWNKTDWMETGPIETIPQGKTCFVYRRKNGSTTVMQHTGVALGDGTCVHARGTAYGVVKQTMAQHAWTHWGLPKWTEQSENYIEEEKNMSYTAYVSVPAGTSTANLRARPSKSAARIAKVSVGTLVDVLEEADGWAKISTPDGNVGYMMTDFLKPFGVEEPAETAEDEQQEASGGGGEVTIALPREAAAALFKALSEVAF